MLDVPRPAVEAPVIEPAVTAPLPPLRAVPHVVHRRSRGRIRGRAPRPTATRWQLAVGLGRGDGDGRVRGGCRRCRDRQAARRPRAGAAGGSIGSGDRRLDAPRRPPADRRRRGRRRRSDRRSSRSAPTSASGDGAAESIGTGIITTSDGEIVTNAHVVADASKIRVRLAGETEPREARLVAIDVGNDLALLRIAGTGFPAARFADPGVDRHRRRGGGDRLRARPRRSAIGHARHRVGTRPHRDDRERCARRTHPDRRRDLVGQLRRTARQRAPARSSASTPRCSTGRRGDGGHQHRPRDLERRGAPGDRLAASSTAPAPSAPRGTSESGSGTASTAVAARS